MARGRMIDRVVILSKKINSISEGAENLYYRIYVNTDDYGRYHADPEILKGQIYTRKKISKTIIEKRLNELWNIGLIKLYNNNNETYLEIVDFEKHQIFRPDVKKRAEYPEPEKFLQRSRNESDTSRNESEQKRPSKIREVNIIKEKLIKEKAKKTLSQNKIYETAFKEFWEAYPNKIAKEYAKEKFMILMRKGELENVRKAYAGYMDFLKHKRVNENFKQAILNPATFLMKERWREFINFRYKARL